MSAQSLIIRPATLEDTADLLSLVHDCVAGMRAAGIEQWDEVYPDAETITRDIAAGTLDVLCAEGKIAACVTVDARLDPLWAGMDWTAGGEPAMAVHRLMVHPSRQGRGFAKRLMLHAEDVVRGRGGRSIRLDSFLQNPAAMALYQRLGYRRTGTAVMRKGEFAGFEKLLAERNPEQNDDSRELEENPRAAAQTPPIRLYERCGFHRYAVGDGGYWNMVWKPSAGGLRKDGPGAAPAPANQSRATARALAKIAIARGDPLAWFEELYQRSETDAAPIPWADRTPNPNVVALLERRGMRGDDRRALKIGSGLGDDAEYLAGLGLRVTAFDISPTAIRLTRERFPDSAVDYRVADLFALPEDWTGRFDLVWESYTLQVLPPVLRRRALEILPTLLAPGGELVLVSRARDEADPEGDMPWPITAAELRALDAAGLERVSFEDYTDHETPPVRRFRALYAKAGAAGA